jgi:hypothetical protein
MEERLEEHNLIQLVNFPTWSRAVVNVIRESVIDHVYTAVPTLISDLNSFNPYFGDHVVVMFNITSEKPTPVTSFRRSWQHYTKEGLLNMLNNVDWNVEADTVQASWDLFENKLINVVDSLIPVTEFVSNLTKKSVLPLFIKRKINKRKKLLKQYKYNKCIQTKNQVKILDKEIRSHFNISRTNNVRKAITPGNTKSLWQAVKIARDVHTSNYPNEMFASNVQVPKSELSNTFAKFFDNKIKDVMSTVSYDEQVYNGKRLVNSEDKMFMDTCSIRDCIQTLKPKNSEGFDRIPQRVLKDGMEILLAPLSRLFELIYKTRRIPEQWRVAKTIPVFKNKGVNNQVENYCPIANLCSTSKIFEKLILKRILEIQEQNNTDITRVGQHGFKKKRSTSTLSVDLQSIIARALDSDEYALVASLDLSAAFDIVNIELLLIRLKRIGLPKDVIELIKQWLAPRSYYVNIDEANSKLYDLKLGTVQGSVLGPVLYAIFVSPVFDLEPMLTFADDSFIVACNKDKKEVISNLEKSLETITKWLKQSGLKVNQEKTDLCLFYKNDTACVNLNLENIVIRSKKEISVLGVVFDSRLCWDNHVEKAINKANKALNAMKLIARFFNTKELLQLLTSNYFSILYYNAEVWQLSTLKEKTKRKLLSASAKAIRMALHYPDSSVSYVELHQMAKRATPEMFRRYKLCLLLYRTFNEQIPENDWLSLNFEQANTSRQTNFNIRKNNQLMVGMNILNNRFHELNNVIPLDWFNMSINCFKISCKNLFLTIRAV